MAKEGENSSGVVAVTLGILSVVLASVPGIVLGIIALFFARAQKKKHANKWSRAAVILGVIGIILGVLAIYVAIKFSQDLIQYAS